MIKDTILLCRTAIIISIFCISCNDVTISTGDGSEKVKGNGKIISETRNISSFNAISLEGAFNVILNQSDKESVKVEADENILPVIITTVENDTLKIKMKDNTALQSLSKLNVHISFADISTLKIAGAIRLKCADTLHLKELYLKCEGVGATELKLNAEKLTIESDIVGALDLSGTVKETSIDHNGVGILKAFDLKSEKLILKANGVGAAEVYASQELNIDASGIGAIQYRGGAGKKQIKNDGVGKVVCVDCE